MTNTTAEQTTAGDARQVLLALAEQLSDGPHYRIITEAERPALIFDEVTRQHGYGIHALNLDHVVRLLAPTIDWEITRGELAIIFRSAAGGGL